MVTGLDPTGAAFYANMARFLCSFKRQYQESLEYSCKAAELEPNDGDYTFLMGNAYYHTRQGELAKMYCTRL